MRSFLLYPRTVWVVEYSRDGDDLYRRLLYDIFFRVLPATLTPLLSLFVNKHTYIQSRAILRFPRTHARQSAKPTPMKLIKLVRVVLDFSFYAYNDYCLCTANKKRIWLASCFYREKYRRHLVALTLFSPPLLVPIALHSISLFIHSRVTLIVVQLVMSKFFIGFRFLLLLAASFLLLKLSIIVHMFRFTIRPPGLPVTTRCYEKLFTRNIFPLNSYKPHLDCAQLAAHVWLVWQFNRTTKYATQTILRPNDWQLFFEPEMMIVWRPKISRQFDY